MLLDDGSTNSISIPVGITIGLVASSIQSLGLTIQRKSHVLNQEAPEGEQRVEHRRPLWLFGFFIFISSNILGSIFQIASLPVVILAPLGAVSLLWNAVFARLILGDFFSQYMVLGTILIVVGAVLIARFGIVPEPTHSLEDLLRLFRRDAFVAYFSVLAFVVAAILLLTHISEWSVRRRIARRQVTILSPPTTPARLTTALTPSAPSERTPLLDRKVYSPAPSVAASEVFPTSQADRSALNLIAISYASASGILSGMCLLFAKSGVELLVLTFAGDNQLKRWETWALVGGLVVFALLQLWYLHKSLILADPTLVCPLSFCFYNLSSIFNGLIYYDQLNLLSPKHLGLVIVGIVILLGGVWAVSIQVEEYDDDDSEDGTAVAGTREGDWIPTDEEGVAPAVAPADIVRIAERATDTLPEEVSSQRGARLPSVAKDRPSRIVSSPARMNSVPSNSAPVSPVEDMESTTDLTQVASPSTSPARRSRHDRSKSTQVSPTSPTHHHHHANSRPSFVSVLSGGEDQPAPGFSIGLSAVSPGFALGKRNSQRRSSAMHDSHSNGFFARHSMSENALVDPFSSPEDEETRGGGDPQPSPNSDRFRRRGTLNRMLNFVRLGKSRNNTQP